MRKYKLWALGLMIAIAVNAAGCGGPVQEENVTEENVSGETVGAEIVERKEDLEPSIERMESTLAELTKTPRAAGTEEETQAAQWIQKKFEEIGYETSLETFEQDEQDGAGKHVKGTNVVAVRRSDKEGQGGETAEILYITAHHDSKAGVLGAGDNASGVTALLETAALLSDLPAERELRFVSFSGEEDGRIGSRYHVEHLKEEERNRIVGVLNLDELGYRESEFLNLATVDGNTTLFGDCVSRSAEEITGQAIPYKKEGMSDHNSFHTYGIEAVMLSQDAFAYENHTVQDRPEMVDMEKLALAVRVTAEAAVQLMSDGSESLVRQLYGEDGQTVAFQVQPETLLYFGSDRNFVENTMGLSPISQEESVNEYGDTVVNCSYPMKWFHMEEPIESRFQYRRGYLDMIELPMQEAGYSLEETKAIMTEALGMPMGGEDTGALSYDWGDELYHKFYSIQRGDGEDYQVLVMDFQNGKNIFSRYAMNELDEGSVTLDDEKDQKIWELAKTVIHPKDRSMVKLAFYTDGKSNSTGYTTAGEADDNQFMEYGLDYADALDAEGNYLDYDKMIRTAIHEYGHVLSLNSGQVDLTVQDETMPAVFYFEETFARDSYIRAYYEKFWKDMDVKSGLSRYEEKPEDFVSYYGATNMAEDFSESFAQFVLSDMPSEARFEEGLAVHKIRFFYDYPELTERRNWIRGNLGLTEK